MKDMYPKNGRVILHVDMNSFYASVEMSYDVSLKGKPLAIAGNVEERRGIIVTCSYEARKFGVKTTMPIWQAKKLCPQLVIQKPNFERYRKASLAIFDVLRQYTEMVEPVSIDEGYLDISECAELGSPLDIANSIQERILNTMDLPCSIGIAPNKFLAKTASDMKKPMGITILRKRDISEKLWPLQVNEMHGIGDKTSEKLKTIGIMTIRDLAIANDSQLKQLLGINGIRLKDRANGIDPRIVDPEAIFDHKSIGNSTTLPHDSTNQKELIGVLEKLSERVAIRLKNKRLLGQKIGVTIRYKDRRTITRSRTVPNPVFEKKDILDGATDLFMKNWNGEGIRLLGVTAYDVIEKESAFKQLDIFSFQEDAAKEPLYEAMEHLQNKYGENIIKKGLPLKNRSIGTDTSFSKDFFEQSRRNDPSFEKE
ncbi:DNA polymerase IV [Peribacillus simplex]|uniref:DNA polymerase IV n=1 Tax=Peribacillus simplex TaxID=1478 RepID=A0AAW7IC59_9BACI|nr:MULTISPECIES: DNA polymerase IV [Peribacillus]AMM93778.1 DNA polymerase IV [Peribacillus simplex]MDM5293999.1 DNA polymerase IV [Peribacillus simplex]MDM5452944.1 DNA polymerase IV [Peribacillus simplex]MDV7766311.1 DNA polymerase IV [Peribacillus sp. CSMR9]